MAKKAEEKFVWIYPRTAINNLDRCNIFYGTEVEYREWNAKWNLSTPNSGFVNNRVKLSSKFAKVLPPRG